jgi:hypothetical protein
MKINNENIKSKVVIGFTLALSVVVFAIYLTYNSFTQSTHFCECTGGAECQTGQAAAHPR